MKPISFNFLFQSHSFTGPIYLDSSAASHTFLSIMKLFIFSRIEALFQTEASERMNRVYQHHFILAFIFLATLHLVTMLWLYIIQSKDFRINIDLIQILDQILPSMVLVQKAEKKTVYRYLLSQGVIVIHKDFTTTAHKGTNVPNIQVWMLLRSLKDRGFVEVVFSWQYLYYFLNAEGKKYISEYLGLTEEVIPVTWKKDEKRQYEHFDDQGKFKKVRRDRDNAPGVGGRGGRGAGRRPPRGDVPQQQQQAKKEETPAQE